MRINYHDIFDKYGSAATGNLECHIFHILERAIFYDLICFCINTFIKSGKPAIVKFFA